MSWVCRACGGGGHGLQSVFILWASVLIVSSLVVGSASALYDDDDSAVVDVGGDDRQGFVADSDSNESARTAEYERKANMRKLLLMALLRLAKDAREEKAEESSRTDGEEFGGGEGPQQFEQKRGRWQGFCFRKSRSGRIHPYICWKGSDI